MKNMKKATSLLVAFLLVFGTLFIGVSAYTEGPELIGIDINLEVGTYSGTVWTPWTGQALHAGDIITVRIAPTSDFLVGIGRYVVMFTTQYLSLVGTANNAFTLNPDNSFSEAVSGTSGVLKLPQGAWPVALVQDGTYGANTATVVMNSASSNSPNGGYPLHLPGEWLYRFNLKVTQDITAGSGARVWMSDQFLLSPAYPKGQMYFYKCLDSEAPATSNASNLYDFNLNLSGANILLEPVAQTSTISFDMNGATSAAIDPITLVEGAPVTPPDEPTKDGFTFIGWDPDLPATMPIDDVTCVAQWQALPTNTITFDLNGGTSAAIAPITLYEGAVVTPPDEPTREGYTFAGWLPDVPETMPIENVTCVAKWVRNQSTITFDSTGGTAVDSITLDEGSEVSAPTAPTKANYAFDGWYLDETLTSPVIWDYTLGTDDVTFYAKWTINQYTISFDSDGGTAVAPITQDYDTPVTEPAEPTKTGYTFAGWDPAIPPTMPAGSMQCTAQWTLNSYTITWDADGGTGGGTNSCDHFATPTAIDAGTKTGYTFAGWDPAIVAATGPATYTAQWTLNNYTITWDANGGTGGGENSCDHGVMPAAIDAGTKTGYTFDGWTPAIVAATGDTTYTAMWKANLVNITFDANGGTGGIGPTAMPYDSPLLAPAVKKEGFVLAGWTPVLPTTVPLTDTTYVAQWETTVVTVTMVGSEFEVNIQGWAADYQYQIWSYQQVKSDTLLADEANVQANQWILSQAYTPGSEGTPDGSNNGSINFMIPDFTSPTENFVIAVRIADANGNFVAEIRDAYTPEAVQEVVITKVLVDGAVTTGYELKEIKAGAEILIKVIGNLPGTVYTAKTVLGPMNASVGNPDEFLWDISAVAPGIYSVEITADNGNTSATQTITFELFSLASNITYGSIDEMNLLLSASGVDITPTYADGTFSFRIREPGRTPSFRSTEYTEGTAGTIAHPITAPGVYHVFGYVTRAGLIGTENGGFDDGLIRTLVIPRTGSGTATMTFTADHALPNVPKSTPIVFTAEALGLPGAVQYSFWRYDATGYVLIKDWSTSDTLNWTPARIGEYNLEARAKGVGAGSYEISRSLTVNITDTVEKKANITGITLNVGDLNANAQPKQPIMLKANATSANGEDILYKFYVYDTDMRTSQLKGYSVDQHCVWTPREAGTYTISVLVKNQYSFGKYDAIESFEVTVN